MKQNNGKTFWDFASEHPDALIISITIISMFVALTLTDVIPCLFK